MHVDPIKLTFKAPGSKRLKLKFDKLLSNAAFKINLRRYTLEEIGLLVEARRGLEAGPGKYWSPRHEMPFDS